MKSPNQLRYDEKDYSLEWVGTYHPTTKTPLELLKEAEPVFQALITNQRKIIRAGLGGDHIGVLKGWRLTLKGGAYGKKTPHHKRKDVRQESGGAEEPN